MKNSRLVLLAGLLVGSFVLSFGGPGPQLWIRPAESKPVPATVVSTAAAQPAADCAACACCRKG